MIPHPPESTLFPYTTLFRSLGDVVTHFRRRNGYTVLRPMGWDSFGLPAENAAISEGGHPLGDPARMAAFAEDRKSTRLNSSHTVISYAVFCLKKKKKI